MVASRAPSRALNILHVNSPPTYLCPLLQQRPLQSPAPGRRYSNNSLNVEYTPQQPKYPQDRPRWQQTPPRMVAPFRSKPPRVGNEFMVNEDPIKLDRVYEKVLGVKGEKMLTEEVKWLAVTHKSFDHGRRGYNDRLSFLGMCIELHHQSCGPAERSLVWRHTGRRIVELQTSIALISSSTARHILQPEAAHAAEATLADPALQGLEKLTEKTKKYSLDSQRIARLGEDYGLTDVVRWKPRKVC